MEDRHLFRGKSLDTGEWIIGHYCRKILNSARNSLEAVPAIQYEEEPNWWVVKAVDPDTLGQCTALRDKNGDLIFEGDIFETSIDDAKYVVEWDSEARFLGVRVKGERIITYVNRVPLVEVIGNIHDNPVLLEG